MLFQCGHYKRLLILFHPIVGNNIDNDIAIIIDAFHYYSRQVITLISRECDKSNCQFSTVGNVYRNFDYTNIRFADLTKLTSHPDIEHLSGLFAPRRIDTNLLVEKNRIPNSEPETLESDEEDENTWKMVDGKGCSIN